MKPPPRPLPLPAGNAQLGLQSLDPFLVDQFRLNRGGNGPLTIDMAFSNAVIDGIRDVRVDSVRADLDRGEISVDLSADTLNLRGDYRVSGKVILIPITGDGQTFIRMGELICAAIDGRTAFTSLEKASS